MEYLYCAKPANADIVKFIVSQPRFNIDHRNKFGYTALLCAANQSQSKDVIVALIDAGANVNHRSKMGSSVLGEYLYWTKPFDSEVVLSLLSAGFNPHALSKFDRHLITKEIRIVRSEKAAIVLIKLYHNRKQITRSRLG